MNSESLLAIAKEFSTPVYVYDASVIERQYDRLYNAFNKKIKIHYALKALNNINVLKILKAKNSGLDAVSLEEIHLGLRAGFKGDEIMYTPNCVSFDEIVEAVKLGVHVNIDNLSILEKFGKKYGNTQSCCIRLNPHILAGGNSKISVGHIDSKFGISIYQIQHILRLVNHYDMKVNGLHMHTGSDIIDADVFLTGAELIYDAARNFPDLNFLNFGSGFKVSYKEGDYETNIEEIAHKILKSFNSFCTQYGKKLELWFEPGKYLVSEAGKLLVSVNVIKQTTSTVFAGVNSGQNHLIRPMFYDAYHNIHNISNTKREKKLYSVVGNICESDTLGYDRMINEIHEKDVLCIDNAGAYCFTMSNQYNSRLRPAEVLVKNEKAYLIRKREVLEDVYRNEIEIKDFVDAAVLN